MIEKVVYVLQMISTTAALLINFLDQLVSYQRSKLTFVWLLA